jgi:hypothetical protein
MHVHNPYLKILKLIHEWINVALFCEDNSQKCILLKFDKFSRLVLSHINLIEFREFIKEFLFITLRHFIIEN